ncbi:tetratricopeptide repeat protein [Paracoccus pacificus]|uniref:Tetratricopeptide repeat protein n=1 Tax=Paracoccus pacificus TaxID=1463598 RepID=A0ABW4R844_9RHOB
MANQNDSFIDEVTEEVRRDRLYALFRRYGWIALVVILAIVAGSAWSEWSKSRARAAAQSWGDAAVTALESSDPATALAGLDALDGKGRRTMGELLAAGADVDADKTADAAAKLEALGADANSDPLLRELARLKLVMMNGETMDPAERDRILTELSAPGQPYALLALEQKAVALTAAGRTDDAVTLLRQLRNMDGLTPGLSRRVNEQLMALGANDAPDETADAADGTGPDVVTTSGAPIDGSATAPAPKNTP